MERASTSLHDLLGTVTPTEPVPDAARLICEICEAVVHMRALGWVHGDLKPSNVLLLEERNRPPRRLRSRARARGIPDLLVAAAAEERDLTVVHDDAAFDLIASVTGQRCSRIVPAGSAD
jgi:serine/threonine protein kinase